MYTKLLAQGAKFGSGATVWTTLLYSIVYFNMVDGA